MGRWLETPNIRPVPCLQMGMSPLRERRGSTWRWPRGALHRQHSPPPLFLQQLFPQPLSPPSTFSPTTLSPTTLSPSTLSPSTHSPTSTLAPTKFCNSLRRCYDCTRAGCKWAKSSTSMGCTPPSSCTSAPGCFFFLLSLLPFSLFLPSHLFFSKQK